MAFEVRHDKVMTHKIHFSHETWPLDGLTPFFLDLNSALQMQVGKRVCSRQLVGCSQSGQAPGSSRRSLICLLNDGGKKTKPKQTKNQTNLTKTTTNKQNTTRKAPGYWVSVNQGGPSFVLSFLSSP